MVEIYTDGSSFTNIIEEASLIKRFTRESYAIRYRDKALWDFNLKLGGVHGSPEVAKLCSDTFVKLFGGFSKFKTKDETGETYLFFEGKIKRCLFAGGCFWCIAQSFYDHEGVLRVLSGYAGGSELNPSYKEVKAQLTHHKECILVEYDSLKTDYTRMVDIYFENRLLFRQPARYDAGFLLNAWFE